MVDKLSQLLSRQEQLKAQLQLIQQQTGQEKRKLDTRRKILLGSLTLHLLDTGKLDQQMIVQALDQFLTKPNDRLVFQDLLPEQQQTPKQPEEAPVPAAPVKTTQTKTTKTKARLEPPLSATAEQQYTASVASPTASPSQKSKPLQDNSAQAKLRKEFEV